MQRRGEANRGGKFRRSRMWHGRVAEALTDLEPRLLCSAAATMAGDSGLAASSNYAAADYAVGTDFGYSDDVPSKPRDLHAWIDVDGQITIAWSDRSDDENGFVLYRSTDVNFTTYTNVVLPEDEEQYHEPYALPPGDYYYAIRAFNFAGYSNWSDLELIHVASVPNTPYNLRATMDGAGNIQINWSIQPGQQTGLVLQRYSDDQPTWQTIQTFDASVTSYIDWGTPDRIYAYRLAATTSEATSPWTDAVGVARRPVVLNMYRDVLGREGDDAGVSYWSWQLITNSVSTTQLATAFLSSTEYRTNQIRQLYQQILGRDADAAGLSAWLSFFQRGGTVEQIEAGFYGSDEYFNAHGGANAGVLTAYYQTFLGRDPEPAGLVYWGLQLEYGISRATIAQNILANSVEGRQFTVRNLYHQYLRRDPEPAGLDYWTDRLVHGLSDVTLRIALLGSDEYAARP